MDTKKRHWPKHRYQRSTICSGRYFLGFRIEDYNKGPEEGHTGTCTHGFETRCLVLNVFMLHQHTKGKTSLSILIKGRCSLYYWPSPKWKWLKSRVIFNFISFKHFCLCIYVLFIVQCKVTWVNWRKLASPRQTNRNNWHGNMQTLGHKDKYCRVN